MFAPGVVMRSVRSNTAGSKMAMTTRNSIVDSKLALAWLKVCRVRPMPPTRAEIPRNSNVVPMIEPVVCAYNPDIRLPQDEEGEHQLGGVTKADVEQAADRAAGAPRQLLGGAPKPIGEHRDGGGTGEKDPAGGRIDDVTQNKG